MKAALTMAAIIAAYALAFHWDAAESHKIRMEWIYGK